MRTISAKAGRKAILQVLKSTNGNVSETARLLNATRRTIYKALKKEKTGDMNYSALRFASGGVSVKS